MMRWKEKRKIFKRKLRSSSNIIKSDHSMARQQQAAEEMEPQNAAVGGRRIRTANTHISKFSGNPLHYQTQLMFLPRAI